LGHSYFSALALAVFDAWGRLTETGSGNQSSLVAFESAQLEERGGRLTFCKILKFVVYYTAIFRVDIGRVRRVVSPRRNRKWK